MKRIRIQQIVDPLQRCHFSFCMLFIDPLLTAADVMALTEGEGFGDLGVPHKILLLLLF